MPVFVFPKSWTALFIVLSLTKLLAGDDESEVLLPLEKLPSRRPVVPWRRALLVFGPGEPPVPFTMPGVPEVAPAAEPAPPLDPAPLFCA
jgi:hypothetical protein